MRSCLAGILALFGGLCLPSAVGQEEGGRGQGAVVGAQEEARSELSGEEREALALAGKVDDVLYNPVTEGLETLKVTFENPAWKAHPLFSKARLVYYWKAPYEWKVDIEGIPRAYESIKAARLIPFRRFSQVYTPKPYRLWTDRARLLAEGDAQGGRRLRLVWKDEKHPIAYQVHELDENLLPVRKETVFRGGGESVVEEHEYEKLESGKYVLRRARHLSAQGEYVMEFHYEEYGGFLLPKRVVRRPLAGDGGGEDLDVYEIEVERVEVNVELPDSLFADK